MADQVEAVTTAGSDQRSDRWWINRDFAALWLGQGLTHLASQVILLVLPLIAVFAFDASPRQVGLLGAAQFAPVFVVSLFAGVWADTVSRRVLLLVAHLGRALLLALLPLLALVGSIDIGVLYLVGFGVGTLTAIFDVCHQTYVADLVTDRELVAANSRMQSTYTFAQVAGPGVGGLLVSSVGAMRAVLPAVAAHLVATAATMVISRGRDGPPGARLESVRQRIAAGLRITARHRVMRVLTLGSAWFNLFEQAVLTAYLVFAVRVLHLTAGRLGLTMALGAVGALLGSLAARAIGARLGVTRTMVAALGLASGAPILIGLAPDPGWLAFGQVTLAFALYGFGITVFNVYNVSARQRLVPREFIGRVTATFRFVAFGTIPLGALVGGVAGGSIGLRPTLLLATAALMAGWLAFAVACLRVRSELDTVRA
jgi:MFS family permease